MKILIHSSDYVGAAMAGPGIRAWEFSRSLARHHEVTLRVPNATPPTATGFRVVRDAGNKQLVGQDVLISQFVAPPLARAASARGVRIILDAYDPIALEHLVRHRTKDMATRSRINAHTVAWQSFSLAVADGIICASERQRDFWLGALLSQTRLDPVSHDSDPSFRSLIDVVPFGLPDAAPERSAARPLRSTFGLDAGDVVLVWGGGVWDWLDPLTIIRAVAELARRRSDVKLVFMGTRHPNPSVPSMSMLRQAEALARRLGLRDRHVFFNEDWVPYADRAAYLLDGDIGVSMHREELEARFAFRTRVLDYIWAELPVICTVGDSLADLIDREQLGVTVPPNDPDATVSAIVKLADDAAQRAAMRARLRAIRPQFAWSRVTQPLEMLVEQAQRKPPLTPNDVSRIAFAYYSRLARTAALARGSRALKYFQR